MRPPAAVGKVSWMRRGLRIAGRGWREGWGGGGWAGGEAFLSLRILSLPWAPGARLRSPGSLGSLCSPTLTRPPARSLCLSLELLQQDKAQKTCFYTVPPPPPPPPVLFPAKPECPPLPEARGKKTAAQRTKEAAAATRSAARGSSAAQTLAYKGPVGGDSRQAFFPPPPNPQLWELWRGAGAERGTRREETQPLSLAPVCGAIGCK